MGWWSKMAVGKSETPVKAPRATKKGETYHPNRRGTKDQGEGQLGVMAAMMLMTILYTCRVARPEITRAITFLAKRITKWDFRCDQRLHRLMCYVNCATDDQMMGWIGDDPSELSAHLFCDADFYQRLPCRHPGTEFEVSVVLRVERAD